MPTCALRQIAHARVICLKPPASEPRWNSYLTILAVALTLQLESGEWLPWLKQQQESGAIGFSHKTATKYMSLAANMNRGSYLPEATSMRAALELLSDSLQIRSALRIWKASNFVVCYRERRRLAAKQLNQQANRRKNMNGRRSMSDRLECWRWK